MTTETGNHGMGLAEAAREIKDGAVTSRQLVDDCLGRVESVDGEIEAWAHLDPEKASEQADERDRQRKQGKAIGPLHGVPIAVKDVIDTAHTPTEYGCALHKGRIPFEDAWVVDKLRNAGAVIMGKTVTAELASCGPGKTKNPHDPTRTPGGSSSGSAAAVASYQVPGAIGTQTGGSVIRPASYCGIYGFKPTWGMIPRTGVLLQSHAFDTLGGFGRSIEDVALLTETLFGHDSADGATSVLNYAQPLREIAMDEPPVGVKLGFARTPKWGRAEPATQAAFEELSDALGASVEAVDLPPMFERAWDCHRTIMHADNAHHYAGELAAGRDRLHPELIEVLDSGATITASDYLAALEARDAYRGVFSEIMEDYDALITPAAAGEAPVGLASTGDPVFCSLWSLLGCPALSMPLMVGENGLPLGVQLIGDIGDDGRLLRTANWLVGALAVE